MLYNMLYNILYNIVWMIAWCSARDGPEGARSFHCQLAYYTRMEKKVDAMFIKDLIQKYYTTQTLIQMTWITTCTSG